MNSDHLVGGASSGATQPALVVGNAYKVASSRKGKFTMRVTSVDDTWATGIVVDGKAGAMLSYNERDKGEEVTVRREFCAFTPIFIATGAA